MRSVPSWEEQWRRGLRGISEEPSEERVSLAQQATQTRPEYAVDRKESVLEAETQTAASTSSQSVAPVGLFLLHLLQQIKEKRATRKVHGRSTHVKTGSCFSL